MPSGSGSLPSRGRQIARRTQLHAKGSEAGEPSKRHRHDLQALYCDACGAAIWCVLTMNAIVARIAVRRYSLPLNNTSPVAHAAPPSLRGPLFGVAGLLLAAVFAVVLWQVSVSPRTPRNEVIDASTVELSPAAPVQALQGEKARDKLLVMVTNRGTRVVVAPHVAANFYGGSTKLESRSAYAQTSVLRPGRIGTGAD